MADTDLKITITAEDKASGTFSSLSSKLGGLGDAASAAGKIIGTGLMAAVGTLAAFGVASFNAFMDAEKQTTQATLSLQNTFNDLTSKEVARMKAEMSDGKASFDNLTEAMGKAGDAAVQLGFDDEDASQAFAKLFSITHDVTKSQEELKLAQDLAAFSGRDLASATDALAMVHAGGTRVLKEFGIQVDSNTTSAQALQLIQDRVTGSAEAMANTTAGKLQTLSIEWGNLKETVGGVLAEALTPFINMLSDFAKDPQTQEKLKQIANGMAEFARQMAPVVQQLLPVMITLLGAVAKGIGEVANFLFKTLPDAIANAIIWVENMIDKLSKFIQKIEDALNKLKSLVSAPQGGSLNPFSSNFALPSWVPKFADGGIVTSPTLAMVGEGGEPEAIIPFSKLGGMGGGMTIVITGNTISDSLDLRSIASQVSEVIIDKLKLNHKVDV